MTEIQQKLDEVVGKVITKAEFKEHNTFIIETSDGHKVKIYGVGYECEGLEFDFQEGWMEE